MVMGRPFFHAESSAAGAAVDGSSTTVAFGAELRSSGVVAPAVCCAAAGAIIASQAASDTTKRNVDFMIISLKLHVRGASTSDRPYVSGIASTVSNVTVTFGSVFN